MKSFKHIIGHLVSCKDASHLLSEREDRKLTVIEGWTLKWHLAVCTMCMAFEKQMRILRDAMRRYRE